MTANMMSVPRPTETLRDHFGKKCPYCGKQMRNWAQRRPTREHVIPRSKGGHQRSTNRIIVCAGCNSLKGDMMPDEWLAWVAAHAPHRVEKVAAIFQHYGRYRRPPHTNPDRGTP